MPEKSNKELATELTIAWLQANSELKGINGASKLAAIPISMVQNGYITFLNTINDPKGYDSSK